MDHPRGRNNSSVVKMDVFYSMWVAQTVPCPWGSGKPACKAVLLHHEQVCDEWFVCVKSCRIE
mgnify:CR=1 FL=1